MRDFIGRRKARLALRLAGLAMMGGLCGCSIIRPYRTLPTWVRGIYIPMAQNKSTTPGLEEIVTRRIQEEFLADGRINVVPKASADLMLAVTITEYTKDYAPFGRRGRRGGFGGSSSSSSTGSSYNSSRDRIPQFQELLIMIEMKLYDPMVNPYEPQEEPFADLGVVSTQYTYPSDFRSEVSMIEPDVKVEAMSLVARRVVFQTINGFPTQIEGAPEGSTLPTVRPPDAGGTQGDVSKNPQVDRGWR